jgi:predicted small metal-binding protein
MRITTWTLACGDVLPGCTSVLEGPTRDAVLAAVVAHAGADHGVTSVDDATFAAVQAALREPVAA